MKSFSSLNSARNVLGFSAREGARLLFSADVLKGIGEAVARGNDFGLSIADSSDVRTAFTGKIRSIRAMLAVITVYVAILVAKVWVNAWRLSLESSYKPQEAPKSPAQGAEPQNGSTDPEKLPENEEIPGRIALIREKVLSCSAAAFSSMLMSAVFVLASAVLTLYASFCAVLRMVTGVCLSTFKCLEGIKQANSYDRNRGKDGISRLGQACKGAANVILRSSCLLIFAAVIFPMVSMALTLTMAPIALAASVYARVQRPEQKERLGDLTVSQDAICDSDKFPLWNIVSPVIYACDAALPKDRGVPAK